MNLLMLAVLLAAAPEPAPQPSSWIDRPGKGGARPVKTYDGLPSLPKGPLKAGAYSRRVIVSLANGVKLMGDGDVRVK